MDCEEYQKTISKLIDHEVRATATADLFVHLGACQHCREFYDLTVSLGDLMEGVAKPDEVICMEAKDLQLSQRWHGQAAGRMSHGLGVRTKSSRNVLSTLLLTVFVIAIWCVLLSTTISVGGQIEPGFGLAQQPPSSSKPR